jgi:predicted secreted protein
VVASVGWAGALAVFLAHTLASLLSQDELIVRTASIAMSLTTWFVILPLSIASLSTGLVQALGTAWGLFQHYWVLFKLLLTAVATIVLLMKLGPIESLVDAVKEATFPSADHIGLRASLTVHAAGGLLALIAVTVLAVYKPAGMTQYGLRKQWERNNSGTAPAPGLTESAPRWVKVFGAVIIVFILLLSIMVLGGGHGPSAHI